MDSWSQIYQYSTYSKQLQMHFHSWRLAWTYTVCVLCDFLNMWSLQGWSQHIGIWSMLTGLAFGRVKVQYILLSLRLFLFIFLLRWPNRLMNSLNCLTESTQKPRHLLEQAKGDKTEEARGREAMRGWSIPLSKGKEEPFFLLVNVLEL